MKIEDIKNNEQYKEAISEIDLWHLKPLMSMLVEERIKKYPEKPLSELLDVRYDLNILSSKFGIDPNMEVEILKGDIGYLKKKLETHKRLLAIAVLVIMMLVPFIKIIG